MRHLIGTLQILLEVKYFSIVGQFHLQFCLANFDIDSNEVFFVMWGWLHSKGKELYMTELY